MPSTSGFGHSGIVNKTYDDVLRVDETGKSLGRGKTMAGVAPGTGFDAAPPHR